MTTQQETLCRLTASGIVPVIRTTDDRTAARAVDWLTEAGIDTVEITLTTPGALPLIRRLCAETNLLVGAGTVMSAEAARDCIGAGAAYIVSPALAPDVAAACQEAGVPAIIGALTPSEVAQAQAAGADAVKIFPVGSVGGPSYVSALRAVFPEITLAPTGGIAPEAIGAYLDAGASFVGIGGKLVDEVEIAAGHRAAITGAANEALAQVKQHRERGVRQCTTSPS